MPPILLLKTKSSPQDGYEEFFTENNYTPTFVPVLEHRFHAQNLSKVRDLFNSGAFGPNAQNGDTSSNPNNKYGGLIFTSQRAVEGFAQMIEEGAISIPSTPLTLYTVGPATARTLQTVVNAHLPQATIYGAESGTGENLAHFILEHYNTLFPETEVKTNYGGEKPALLFLVGEVRRDIIPRTLMEPSLGERAIGVEEIVVYETGVMGGFEGEFGGLMRGFEKGEGHEVVWVVVFSPTGCEAMLRVLEIGPFAGSSENGSGSGSGAGVGRKVFVATIGPTTRDYLRETFGFEAHVCASKPSPQGVLEGIQKFMGV